MEFGSRKRERLEVEGGKKKKKWQEEASSSSEAEITREDIQQWKEQEDKSEPDDDRPSLAKPLGIARSLGLAARREERAAAEAVEDDKDVDKAEPEPAEPAAPAEEPPEEQLSVAVPPPGPPTDSLARRSESCRGGRRAERDRSRSRSRSRSRRRRERSRRKERDNGNEVGRRGRKPQEEVEQRNIDLTEEEAKAVTEHGNKMLRELGALTRCKVELQRSGEEGAQMVMSGPGAAVDCARDLAQRLLAFPGTQLAQILDKVPTQLYERAAALGGESPPGQKVLEIPARKRGLVLGPNGTTLQRIRTVCAVAECRLEDVGEAVHLHIAGPHMQLRECEGLIKRLLAGDHCGLGFETRFVPIQPQAAMDMLATSQERVEQVEDLGVSMGCNIEVDLEPELGRERQPRISVTGPPVAVTAAMPKVKELLANPRFHFQGRFVELPADAEVLHRFSARASRAVRELATLTGCLVQMEDEDAGAPRLAIFGKTMAAECAEQLARLLIDSDLPDRPEGGLQDVLDNEESTESLRRRLTKLGGCSPFDNRTIHVPNRCRGLFNHGTHPFQELSGVKVCSLENIGHSVRLRASGLRCRVEECEELVQRITVGDVAGLGYDSHQIRVDRAAASKLTELRGRSRAPADEISDLVGCAVDVKVDRGGAEAGATVSVIGPPDVLQEGARLIGKFLAAALGTSSAAHEAPGEDDPAYEKLTERLAASAVESASRPLRQRAHETGRPPADRSSPQARLPPPPPPPPVYPSTGSQTHGGSPPRAVAQTPVWERVYDVQRADYYYWDHASGQPAWRPTFGPEGFWEAVPDPAGGRGYYWNAMTNQSAWVLPVHAQAGDGGQSIAAPATQPPAKDPADGPGRRQHPPSVPPPPPPPAQDGGRRPEHRGASPRREWTRGERGRRQESDSKAGREDVGGEGDSRRDESRRHASGGGSDRHGSGNVGDREARAYDRRSRREADGPPESSGRRAERRHDSGGRGDRHQQRSRSKGEHGGRRHDLGVAGDKEAPRYSGGGRDSQRRWDGADANGGEDGRWHDAGARGLGGRHEPSEGARREGEGRGDDASSKREHDGRWKQFSSNEKAERWHVPFDQKEEEGEGRWHQGGATSRGGSRWPDARGEGEQGHRYASDAPGDRKSGSGPEEQRGNKWTGATWRSESRWDGKRWESSGDRWEAASASRGTSRWTREANDGAAWREGGHRADDADGGDTRASPSAGRAGPQFSASRASEEVVEEEPAEDPVVVDEAPRSRVAAWVRGKGAAAAEEWQAHPSCELDADAEEVDPRHRPDEDEPAPAEEALPFEEEPFEAAEEAPDEVVELPPDEFPDPDQEEAGGGDPGEAPGGVWEEAEEGPAPEEHDDAAAGEGGGGGASQQEERGLKRRSWGSEWSPAQGQSGRWPPAQRQGSRGWTEEGQRWGQGAVPRSVFASRAARGAAASAAPLTTRSTAGANRGLSPLARRQQQAMPPLQPNAKAKAGPRPPSRPPTEAERQAALARR